MRSTRALVLALSTLSLIACGEGVSDAPGIAPADGGGNAQELGAPQPCAGHGGDDDEDDVCQAIDNCPAVENPAQTDSDRDGVGDACDEEYSPCVLAGGDTDGDGICDPKDNCPTKANTDQADDDGDDVGDACDPVNGSNVCAGKGGDDDDDDVCDLFDNCPGLSNSDQQDKDKDGVGDLCDSSPLPCSGLGGDTDGDTICDVADNCPGKVNANQWDSDDDGVGDACDEPTGPPDTGPCAGLGGDTDHDDWCATYDNCPAVYNPSQSDADQDGKGDACDTEECDGVDNDGDGEVDEGFANADGDDQADCADPCPAEPNSDYDHDGKVDCADPCPEDAKNDADSDGVCAGEDNCPTFANGDQKDSDGDGAGDACDHEECDGLDNDGISGVDNGLPDADGDGTCDGIDPCPTDPDDDVDQDGLCRHDDNCPNVPNADQADADGDGWGDFCDLDSSSVSCGPGATLEQPGTVPLPANIEVADLVTDPVRQIVYASVAASSPSYPNQVVAIDPGTTSVLWSLMVGTKPRQLAISKDGTRLYVSLWGSGSVRVIDPDTRRACLDFPIGRFDGPHGPLAAREMEVLPGSPDIIVVSTWQASGAGGERTYVFDHGCPRPVHTAHYAGVITLASDTEVYAHDDTTSEYPLARLIISGEGVQEEWRYEKVFHDFHLDLLYSGGRVYATTGEVILAGAPIKFAGNFNAKGQLAIDPALDRLFVLRSSKQVSVYQASTLQWVKDVTLPGSVGEEGQRLVRWGSDGLAALVNGKPVIVSGVAN